MESALLDACLQGWLMHSLSTSVSPAVLSRQCAGHSFLSAAAGEGQANFSTVMTLRPVLLTAPVVRIAEGGITHTTHFRGIVG